MEDIFKELIEEMNNQNIPAHWEEMVLSAMARNQKRIDLMMEWLINHRDIGYDSLELVNSVIDLKKKTPMDI